MNTCRTAYIRWAGHSSGMSRVSLGKYVNNINKYENKSIWLFNSTNITNIPGRELDSIKQLCSIIVPAFMELDYHNIILKIYLHQDKRFKAFIPILLFQHKPDASV